MRNPCREIILDDPQRCSLPGMKLVFLNSGPKETTLQFVAEGVNMTCWVRENENGPIVGVPIRSSYVDVAIDFYENSGRLGLDGKEIWEYIGSQTTFSNYSGQLDELKEVAGMK